MLLLLLSFFSHHIHIVTSQTDSYNNHLNHNHTPVSDSYGCGNCSGVIYSAGAGFHCHQDDKNSIIRNKCQMESPYPKCMPGYFEIKYPIKEYCCFWNSKLGCGILVNEKYFGDNDICHKQCHCFCHRTISGAWKIKLYHGLVILLSVIFVASNNF